MADWSEQEQERERIGAADELRLASRREDDSLRPFVTMWVVAVGDDLFVRSGGGRENGWFRRALVRHEGRVEADGVTCDVRLTEADPAGHAAIDAAYHAKYDRFGPQYVDPVVSPESWTATLRLDPID